MGEIRAERARVRARDLRRLLREPVEVVRELADGRDLVLLRLGHRRIFIVNNPELVERVLAVDVERLRRGGSSQAYRLGGESLVSAEGEVHARRRRLVAPFFAGEALARCATVVTEVTTQLEGRWADGAVRDIDADMNDHMLDVIGTVILGADYRSEAATIREAFDASRKVIRRELLPFSVVLWTLPLPASRRYNSARAALMASINRLAAKRKAAGDRSDLLGLLVAAVDEEGGLTERVIADEVWGFLAQGAPAHVMTWCWWLLATHSQSERRFHDELEQLAGRLPTAPDRASLPITRAIVLEALRLWPPVWGIDRVALGDYSLGDQRIPKGATVFISPYITHRDERYWSDAKTFDPGRWLNGTATGIDDYRYLPFGAGQRRCIAREFVLLHCILTLATLGRHWQPRPVSQRLEVASFPFLRPRVSMRMLRRASG